MSYMIVGENEFNLLDFAHYQIKGLQVVPSKRPLVLLCAVIKEPLATVRNAV